jgi:hypothetical protein
MNTKHRVSIEQYELMHTLFHKQLNHFKLFYKQLFILNHSMIQKVHNMYCDFLSIQIMRSILYIYMIESIQSSYLSITLDTFFTHTRRYVESTLMLGFCMNPYATCFSSSLSHVMYSYSIMFSQRTLREKLLLPNISEDHSL